MADQKKPEDFEELMRCISQPKQFPIDLQPISPAAPVRNAAEGDETEPPLTEFQRKLSEAPPRYSPEWFRWVEGRFLDPDDPPVPERYLKQETKP